MPTHGEYRAGFGFYDSGRRGWINDPAKLSQTIPAPEATQAQRDAVASWGNKRDTFKRDAEMDGLIRLRDSQRPEDRANYDRLAKGPRRMAVGAYETALAKAKDSGADIIDATGVVNVS